LYAHVPTRLGAIVAVVIYVVPAVVATVVVGAVATGAIVEATQMSEAPPEYWYVPGYPPAEHAIPGEIDPPVVGAVVAAVGAAVVAVTYGIHAMFAEPPA
jgi:hypothetical protein